MQSQAYEETRGIIEESGDTTEQTSSVSLYDAQLIKLQALRADVQPAANALGKARFDMVFQYTDTPRLWLDPQTYVAMEQDAVTYRLKTEASAMVRTLFITRARCEIADFVRKYRTQQEFQQNNQLTQLYQMRTQVERRARWPEKLAIGLFGALCGALAMSLFQ